MLTKEQREEVLSYIEEGYGPWIDVGPGWEDLVWETHCQMKALDPEYRIHQIKEKFGGLRFYHSSNSDKTWEIEEIAEERSMQICEVCGEAGNLHKSMGWLRTTCEEHDSFYTTTRSI